MRTCSLLSTFLLTCAAVSAQLLPGAEFMVDTTIHYVPAPGLQTAPAVAFDGTNYLVVWEDHRDEIDIYAARVTPEGVVLDREGIEVCTASGSQELPAVAFDGANYLVVWDDTRNGALDDIYGARVTPDGNVLDPTGFAISTADRHQYEPAIVFNGADYLVTWTDSRAGSGEFDIYGTRVSPARVVRDTAGIPIAVGAQMSLRPAVAFDGTNCLVAWQSGLMSGFTDVRGARVSPAGTVLDPDGIAVTTADSSQSSPAVAFDGTNYLVVWEDGRNGPTADIYGARVSPGGSVLDTAGITVSSADLWQGTPSVAFDGTNYLVAWDDLRGTASTDVYAARLSRDGVLLDPTGFVVSGAGNEQTIPALACDGTNCLAVWTDARSTSSSDVYGARITPSAAVLDTFGIAVTATVNVQNCPAAAFDGTNYFVAWADDRNGDYDIYGARISPTGTVLDPAALAVSAAAGHQGYPVVGFDGTNYLVAWEDERRGRYSDIYGARVTPDGVVLDPAGIAVSLATNLQRAPAIAYDGADYLVVWQDFRTASWFQIYGARVTTGGEVLDTAGIPISTLSVYQYAPAVAFDGTNCLVAWQDNRVSQYSDIYSARVSPAGVVLDPSGNLVTAAPYGQRYPSIAANGTHCLVAWDDNRNGNGDIYGARVDSAGITVDTAGFAVYAGAQVQYTPKLAFNGTDWLAAWRESRGATSYDIYGARVAATGAVVDSFVVSTQSDDQLAPVLVCGSGGNVLAAWFGWTDTLFGEVYGAHRVWARAAPFTPISIAEAPDAGTEPPRPGPTIVRGVLNLQPALGYSQRSGSPLALLDAAGRKVMELRTGPNDVSHLAPGVCFVREAQAVRKVIVRR
jgi:hypothetical protein